MLLFFVPLTKTFNTSYQTTNHDFSQYIKKKINKRHKKVHPDSKGTLTPQKYFYDKQCDVTSK